MNGVELLEQVYVRREAGEATACQTCVSKCLSDKLDSGAKASDQDQAICFSECGCSKEGTESDRSEMIRKWNNAGDFQRQKMLQRSGNSGPALFKKLFDDLPPPVQEDLIEFDIAGEQFDDDDDDDDEPVDIRNFTPEAPTLARKKWNEIPRDRKQLVSQLAQKSLRLTEDQYNRMRIPERQAFWKRVLGESLATEQDIISRCKTCGFTGGMKDIIKHSDDTGHDDIELMGATKEINLIEETLEKDCGCKFNKFAGESVKRLEKTHGKEVAFMFGKIEAIEGMKIKGKLAYAGVSHNNRLYLPEALQKGDKMELPMIFNHASPDGAEFELSRLPSEIRESILNHEHIRVGDVKLFWDQENLTLFYEGEVNDEFFAKEIDQGLMSVSLGMLFDADSPEICDQECYTVVKGAEFTEVSLVYHPGFPIATIESNEIRLKKRITPRRYKL